MSLDFTNILNVFDSQVMTKNPDGIMAASLPTAYKVSHHHHLSFLDGMVEAADTKLRQVVKFVSS